MGAQSVLRDAVIVVGAGQDQILAVVQTRTDRDSLPFLGRLVAERLECVCIEVDDLGALARHDHTHWQHAVGDRDVRDIGGAGKVDLEDILVRVGQGGADAESAVVALQNQELVIAQRDQFGNTAALAGRLELVGELTDCLTRRHVVLHDTCVQAGVVAFIVHPALQRGVGKPPVRADGESFEATIRHTASGVALVVGKVRRIRTGIPRNHICRRREATDLFTAAIELDERRAVLVGNEDVAVHRIDDDSFRIERLAQRALRVRREAIQRTALTGQLDRGSDLKVADASSRMVDVQCEALDSGFVGQCAAARAAIRRAPPLAAKWIIEEP